MALFQNISIDQLLSTWAANGGPSEEEKIAYANAASDMLENSKMVEEFIEHVNQFGVWASSVDESFTRITRGFGDMVSKYGSLLPDLKQVSDEWAKYASVGCQVFLPHRAFVEMSVYRTGMIT